MEKEKNKNIHTPEPLEQMIIKVDKFRTSDYPLSDTNEVEENEFFYVGYTESEDYKGMVVQANSLEECVQQLATSFKVCESFKRQNPKFFQQ